MARTAPHSVPLADAAAWEATDAAAPPADAFVGASELEVGSRVVVHSRGRFRLVRVVKVTPRSVTVAYTTRGGAAEAARYGWPEVKVTERTYLRAYVWPAPAGKVPAA